jgi:probable rRNA maturation factor
MRMLNRRHLDRDYATDVLSFSYGDEIVDDMPFMGEIIISPEVVFGQAERYGYCPDRELKKLIVHGLLHLMGYDHEGDRGRMNLMQQRLMRRSFFRTASPVTGSKVNR